MNFSAIVRSARHKNRRHDGSTKTAVHAGAASRVRVLRSLFGRHGIAVAGMFLRHAHLRTVLR